MVNPLHLPARRFASLSLIMPNLSLPRACADYADAELMAMIRAGGASAEQALTCLYNLYFGLARQSMAHHQLDEAAVLDAYANALFALRDQVCAGKFRGEGSLKAFFAKIFKFKCIDEFRRATTKRKDDDTELRRDQEETLATLTPEERLLWEEAEKERPLIDDRRAECMDKALAPFSARDRAMLADYFIRELPLDEIVPNYGLKNKRVAAVILSKLKKKLEESIVRLCQNEPNCQLLCPGGRR